MSSNAPLHLVADVNDSVRRIVGIHGAPRSGTSWLGQLFNSSEHVAYRYQPMFSYAFKDRLNVHSSVAEVSGFFADLLQSNDEFVLQRGKASMAGYELSFAKKATTHLVYKEVRHHQLLTQLLRTEPRLLVIGLIRNPCAVLHSWIHAPREFQADWNVDEEWWYAPGKNEGHPENWYGFQKWKELALLLHRLRDTYPKRVHLVRYEELIAAPTQMVKHLFLACDLPWNGQTQDFIRRTHAQGDNQPYGVFRDRQYLRAESWRRGLDERILRAIHDDLADGPLSIYLSPADP
jgi:hypothetical protein